MDKQSDTTCMLHEKDVNATIAGPKFFLDLC